MSLISASRGSLTRIRLFIKTSAATVGIVLGQTIDSLKAQDQLELNDYLRLYLIGRVLLDENSRQILQEP
ncbi:hypothetical protein DFQ27_006987 [Actinomortierella ambigua]|uniref:Uncharacterized protein n=1 Tax=Actinomortierella ambigua TaxID=1343610 RepID=A0A9P6PWK5_9FUNG|nr:hypothetical protein DFQ27_006987 [Actinomortierella ambigua]